MSEGKVPSGYHGRYLRIEATSGTVQVVPLSDSVLRQYIGGSGLGVRLLLDEGCAGVDPLDPRSPLIFAFSPLVGSPLTTSATSSFMWPISTSACRK